MTNETGPQQPTMGDACPTCGHLAPASERHCPQCGRPWSAAAPESDITEWAKAGWALFVSDIPMAMGLSLLVVVPLAAFVLFGYVSAIGLTMVADPRIHTPRALAGILGALLAILVVGISVAVPALQAGVYACFLEGIRTGKLSSAKVWAGFHNWWSCTWVSGMLWSALLLCLPLMFILIGIPLAVGLTGLLWFALFRIVDKGRGGMEALSFAWGVMRQRLWAMLAYTLVVMAVMNAGVAGMYIGVVVTVPMGVSVLAAAYDSLSRQRDSLSRQP